MLAGCCGCCNALRPRYKRLVDNIFPALPQDGLVKSNMEKLTFYSLSSPEKLDRIGEYLYQRASRDIYRRRTEYVIIAMEAMDQLLVACHAQSLNLFVESFLKMVQKLLESPEPQLQILATQSFVRFANIEEDTPSYHRRYDFFISKFASMCHSSSDANEQNDIRKAGIRGLQAVIRKTVSDDLVENIWEPVHMDKIVPSLLFNMQTTRAFDRKTDMANVSLAENDEDPPALAESCLRELVSRASFGHIRSVLKPVLKHFELHQLWFPNEFAIFTFRIIMFSIQSQYSYAVVETLMSYLDSNSLSSPKIRTSIADVLSKIIAIAASESVGPSVLEIINSLLSHLRVSVMSNKNSRDEILYQEALINALGEFANHLPDYQKIEIMMFIMSKIPPKSSEPADNLLQNILLKSLLKVGTKYETIHFNTTFPVSFLEPLLRLSLAPDPEMRLLVQKILHTLIDRHRNMEKLARPTANVNELDLLCEKSSRQDLIFINKHGMALYDAMYGCLTFSTNSIDNCEAVYTTLALLCVELASEETVADFLQLLLSIQNLALSKDSELSTTQQFHLHAIVVSLLVLLPTVVSLNALAEYANKIFTDRKREATHLVAELQDHYPTGCPPANELPHLMVDKLAIIECLKAHAIDTTFLEQEDSPYGHSHGYQFGHQQRHSWVEAGARGSVADINGTTNDFDSLQSSPAMSRKTPEEELSIEAMKRVFAEPPESVRLAEAEKLLHLSETYRTAPLSEIVRRTQPKHDNIRNKLNEIFSSLSDGSSDTRKGSSRRSSASSVKDAVDSVEMKPLYEEFFPELFVY